MHLDINNPNEQRILGEPKGMIDRYRAVNDEERLALALFKAMEDRSLAEAIEAPFADGFVWGNSGLPISNVGR